jgi:hypothetical protein
MHYTEKYIIEFYRGSQFYWWRKPGNRWKPPICRKSLKYIIEYNKQEAGLFIKLNVLQHEYLRVQYYGIFTYTISLYSL